MDDLELHKLRARVANLELALHGLWAMLQDVQPPAVQDGVIRMMREHFQCMESMGGVAREFQRA